MNARPSTRGLWFPVFAFPAMVVVLVMAADVWGKAAFAGKGEMVRRSEAVAVVRVTAVEAAEVKGDHWTYRQRATATVESVLKGDLPMDAPVTLFGDEDFICARCHFEPGRYVVFLQKDGGLWAGSNWHLSVRPVLTTDAGAEVVDWYAGGDGIETKPTPLADVLADVRQLVEAGK